MPRQGAYPGNFAIILASFWHHFGIFLAFFWHLLNFACNLFWIFGCAFCHFQTGLSFVFRLQWSIWNRKAAMPSIPPEVRRICLEGLPTLEAQLGKKFRFFFRFFWLQTTGELLRNQKKLFFFCRRGRRTFLDWSGLEGRPQSEGTDTGWIYFWKVSISILIDGLIDCSID